MPNHVHGIIAITWARHASPVRDQRISSENDQRGLKPRSLGAIVGSFKSAVTKQINEERGTSGKTIWHRNYYEHIIRDDRDLERIRDYIEGNPANWLRDSEYSR